MESPKVSFILTTYNFGQYIKRAIESLLAQRGGYTFEIIVVDDCSTDNTPKVMAKIEDPRVKYFYNERNIGVAGSINKAFSLTSGEYICRFDGDDEWYPWLLEETIPVLERNPKAGLVYGDISMIDPAGNIMVEKNGTRDISRLSKKEILKTLLFEYFIPAPSIVGKRKAWEDAFPLKDGLIFCDFDLALNILIKWDIAYTPRILSKYRVHGGNIHTTSFDKQRSGELSIMRSVHAFFDKTDMFSAAEKEEIIRMKYLYFAESYFGLNCMADARRCYNKSLILKDLIDNAGSVRRYLATYVGNRTYTGIKSIYNKIAAIG